MSCHCQQDALYASEAKCLRGREFATEAELQRFVDDLRESSWWDAFNPQVLRVEAAFTPARKGSVGAWFPDRGSGRIEMHAEHRCERTVLHELAHVLASARYGSRAHDPWFARVYVELVYLVMGPEAYLELLEAFDRDGISCRPERQDFEMGRARFEL